MSQRRVHGLMNGRTSPAPSSACSLLRDQRSAHPPCFPKCTPLSPNPIARDADRAGLRQVLACCPEHRLIVLLRVQRYHARSGARTGGQPSHHMHAQRAPQPQSITAELTESRVQHCYGDRVTTGQAPHNHLPILCTSWGRGGLCCTRDRRLGSQRTVFDLCRSNSVGLRSGHVLVPHVLQLCLQHPDASQRILLLLLQTRNLRLQHGAPCALLIARQRPWGAFTRHRKALNRVAETLVRHDLRSD